MANNVARPFDALRWLRILVAIAWLAAALSVALLLAQRQLRLLHLWSVPFLLLIAVVFAAALAALVYGGWRALRGPRRLAAARWIMAGLAPPLLWLALGWYGHRQWASRNVPHNLAMALVRMAGASLMEAQASFLYPHQLQSDRIVMFYGDGLMLPQADLDAMDQHVARMEQMTGITHRAKIWWVRGRLLGQGSLAIGGLALGSSQSPAMHTDHHELAHAVLYQGDYPDTDPPMLLVEGWAESQSVDSHTLARRAAFDRRYFAEMGAWWDEIERENKLDTVPDPEGSRRLFRKTRDEGKIDSYLRELTDSFWSHHDAGVVYSIGGAFVDFLLRRYGPQRFVKLYFAARTGSFESECEKIYGLDLDMLEEQFWQDVEQHRQDATPADG